MVIISTSTSLEKIRFACQGWGTIFNDNIQRLEDTYLHLSNLNDVDTSGGVSDKDVLVYSTTSHRWEPMSSGFMATTTTTS